MCKKKMMENNTIFMFPGQGSQGVGMHVGWLGSAAARAVLEEANESLGFDLGKMMAEGADAATLTRTENAQPALLVVGLMAQKGLEEAIKKPFKDIGKYVAGHSLGEYTAVAAAGALGVGAAVRLVRLRGEAMAKAEAGGMSAVLGLAPAQIEEILAQHPNVWWANDNCDGQAVISGTLEALPVVEEALKAAGAKRVLRLPVGGAFHTPLQAEAAAAVAAALVEQSLVPLSLPCLMNYTAQIHENDTEIKNNLIQQITGRVRWREGLRRAAEAGVTQAIELGCGKVLAGLAPRCDSRLQAISLTGQEELLRWLEGVV
jgi:[acyl-carrier-protein] S-malonyltransferase